MLDNEGIEGVNIMLIDDDEAELLSLSKSLIEQPMGEITEDIEMAMMNDEENEVMSFLMEFMIEQHKIIAKQHEESIMQKIHQEFERMTKMIQSKVDEAIGQITTVTATQQEVLSDMSSSTMTAC